MKKLLLAIIASILFLGSLSAQKKVPVFFRQRTSTTHYLNEDTLGNKYKFKYETIENFDDHGHNTITYSLMWDSSASLYDSSEKAVYFYSGGFLHSKRERYSWNNYSLAWILYDIYTFDYDSYGRTLLTTGYSNADSFAAGVYFSKVGKSFSSAADTEYYENYVGGKLQLGATKNLIYHDASGRDTLEVTYIDSSKGYYIYGKTTLQYYSPYTTVYHYYGYDSSKKSWYYTSADSIGYNSHGDIVTDFSSYAGAVYPPMNVYYTNTYESHGLISQLVQNFYYSGYYTIDTVDYGYTDILTHIIHGNIKQSNNNALKNSWVYLLIYDSLDATLRVSDSMKTDTMGNYSFLTNDSILYVYATPDSALYPNEMPTYYDTAIVFPDSRRVVMTADRTVNFKTKAGANPGGAGEIHGIISLCSACKKGGPAIHVKIILTDKNNVPQAYTYTDASGNFSFGKLELKTYKVWVDQVGIKNSLAPSVDLSSSVTKLGQNFTLYPDHLEKDIMNGIAETVQSKTGIKIYPQPAEDKLFMELPGNVRMQICITDIFGRELMHFYSYTEGLDISSLTSGMYILKYTDASNNASVAKFSKK